MGINFYKKTAIISIFVFGLIFIGFASADAAILQYHTRITTPSPSGPFIHPAPNATTADVQVPQPWTGPFKDASVMDRITFGVDHSNMTFVTLAGEVKVKLQLDQWDASNTSSTPNSTTFPELTINYQPFSNTIPYVDKSVFTFSGAYKYRITIVAITQNSNPVNPLPVNLFIDADIIVERYYDFTANAIAKVVTPLLPMTIATKDLDCDTKPDEVDVSWTPMKGAEEYHLEWTFVNDYDLTKGPPYKSQSSLEYDFKNNSTRISTIKNNYKITLTFEHGYLLFRVRAIGKNMNNPSQQIAGVWSEADKGNVSGVSSKYYNQHEHEGDKNWQYSATYAEEGKLKEVISYFDGGLRNRQSVTRVNSDNNTIVGQTIYDHQGRPAINVLPVPVQTPTCLNTNPLKYYPGFNKDSASVNPYSRDDFDVDLSSADSCTAKSGPMSIGSGASNYYSRANPNKTGAQAFVPDGEKYPFTQVEYTPDNTGRIRRQGGVGPIYQLGSNHETKYYYGTPNQIQLDRLFGSEVGDQAHYKKNVVVDANGQVSLSYLDQEGRTIATSLAGDAPKDANNVTILAPLTSESLAQKTLTIDLFSKNAQGQSSMNVKNGQTKALIFNSQLLVAYKSEYEFSYNLTINDFADSCLKIKNVCLNCVYDLEIKVTDDCGRTMIPMTGSHPVFKSIGYFTSDPKGNIVAFNRDCNGPSPYVQSESYKLNLPIGNYTVSKILTVNAAAMDFYVATYLDSNYNKCVKTLFNFQKAALAKIDTSDCRIDCKKCVASLMKASGTTYSTVAEARDQYVAAGIGTELEFDYLMEECQAPCKSLTWCEATYQQLLLDVSPDGQYAQFQNTVGGQVPDLAVSVLHKGNHLPKSYANQLTDWQNPRIKINGTDYLKYLEEDGTESVIHLTLNGTVYFPLVDPNKLAQVKYDSVRNFHYIHPQYLKNVEDFVDNWKETWAKSLVQYHPEYCYYESCIAYSVVPSGHKRSSDDFDKLLLETTTYKTAVDSGLISASYTTSPPSNINQMMQFGYPGSITKDPFVLNGAFMLNGVDYGQKLTGVVGQFRHLGNSYYSMVEVAANAARCGTKYGIPLNASSCKNFGQGLDATILDQEWNLLKNFYLSEKRKIQQQLADDNARGVCNGYNGCIGDPNYNPYLTGMLNFFGASSFFWSSPYFNIQQPCSANNQHLYLKKAKRFIGPENIQSPGPGDMDYQMYLQSGQCPLAIQYQYLLSALAAQGHLDNTGGEDLQKHAEFTPGLYKEVNGGIVNGIFTPYSWKAISTTGNILTGNIMNNATNTPVCGFILNKTGSSINNWDDILSISELTYTNTTGSNFEFKATAGVMGAGGITKHEIITGSTCIRITGCTFATQNTTNQLIKDLGALMSALQVSQVLTSSSAINLVSGNPSYLPFLTTSIKSALGTPNSNLRWRLNGNQYELYDLNNSTKILVIKLLNFSPGIFNNSNIANVKVFSNFTSTSQNFFTMNGMNASNNSIVVIKGSIELMQGNISTPVNTGSTSLPTPIACQGIEYRLRDDLEALLKDVLLTKPTNNEFDLTLSPYYTDLIKSYFPTDEQNTNGTTLKVNKGDIQVDSLIFPIHVKKGDCQMKLYHLDPIPGSNFNNLTGFSSPLIPIGNFSLGIQKFYIVGVFKANGITIQDTIWGYSCLPIKYCEPCPKSPKPDCITCKEIRIYPPDSICTNSLAIFQFETDSCTGKPDLLWNFGDGTTSSIPMHSFARPGTYIVSVSIVRPSGCPRIFFSPVEISINVFNCGGSNEDAASWTWINIDTTDFFMEECESYYTEYKEAYRKF
ncbi:MAG: hypothetical protein ABJB16_05575, partial [Saprospiraceae bacterium]